MSTINRVTIVGAGAAGVACAAELRRLGFGGSVSILGAETVAPYDRPPLSKEYLSGAWEANRLSLQPDGFYTENAIELRLGAQVVGLARERSSVLTSDGASHEYDALVIATGLRPRSLGAGEDPQVLTLRTLDDARRLRERVAEARRVVVIGTGYLGCEIAASCRGLGAAVTLIGPDTELLGVQLSPVVGAMVTAFHRGQGIDVRTGLAVTSVRAEGDRRHVLLSDGGGVVADLVIVAIGSQPNVDWLADNGLADAGGVRCDPHYVAAPGIWAIGDVAAVQNGEERRRHEHRLHATESGLRVAGAIAGDDSPPPPSVPYVWSDQFAHRIQIYGRVPVGSSPRFTHLDLGANEFVAVYPDSSGTVAAVAGCNSARAVRMARSWVAERRPLGDVPGLLALTH